MCDALQLRPIEIPVLLFLLPHFPEYVESSYILLRVYGCLTPAGRRSRSEEEAPESATASTTASNDSVEGSRSPSGHTAQSMPNDGGNAAREKNLTKCTNLVCLGG